jgi:hypothetical protein
MEYKEEYLEQKRKYIEMRDQIMAHFGITEQSGGGIIETVKNALFGEDVEHTPDGGALPYEKKTNVEIIFFNSDNLQPKTKPFEIIKGELFYRPLKDRDQIIRMKRYTFDINDLKRALNNKSYIMKLTDKQANLLTETAAQAGGDDEYTKAVEMFQKLSTQNRERFLNEVLGYALTDVIYGGALPKPIKLEFLKTDIVIDSTNLKKILDVINNRINEMKMKIKELKEKGKITEADASKFLGEKLMDTIIVLERDPNSNTAKVLALYKDYEQ